VRPENPKNKKDILKLAIPLFARGGYSGVSMRQIAKKLG
jgi:AcrR family transcriptional regulator